MHIISSFTYIMLVPYLFSSVPDDVTFTVTPSGDNVATIDWSSFGGSSASIVRYIVNVRQYSSDGAGKTKTENTTGYPLALPGSASHHTVDTLSECQIW